MSINQENLSNNLNSVSDIENKISVESLAQQWAKKYLQSLEVDTKEQESSEQSDLSEISSPAGRERTAKKIKDSLRSVSATAWNKTEALLSTQVKQHHIDSNFINPWDIAADSFKIYEKALDVYTQPAALRQISLVTRVAEESNLLDEQALLVYAEQVAPNQLATVIGADIGALRRKYTNPDSRVIGYVSMQFHYTSQMLMESLEPLERSLIGAYFKVIDDHLYMPLQRVYEAAARHNYNSPVMSAVQQLLPVSTQIAKNICQRVIELFPAYTSMTGFLSDPVVQTSSIRDVEMFQVYLWVCAFEESIAAIQEELFPLCVMLYPKLEVQWELVRQMLHLLRHEISDRLTPQQANTLMPYFQALSQMFSSELLE
jgi:Phycobilisome protein